MDKSAPDNLLHYKSQNQANNAKKVYPNELLLMYRQRAKLSQQELAKHLGLKSTKMLQLWEQGYSLPAAPRLKTLLEVYLNLGVLTPQAEETEAEQLWSTIKNFFDTTASSTKTFPVFDWRWFNSLLTATASTTPAQSQTVSVSKLAQPVSPTTINTNVTVTTHPNNLPTPLNRLIGRSKELEKLQALLLNPSSPPRLLTITGPGGIGKTRLIIELAHQLLLHFCDGVFLVQLAAVSDPLLVLPTIVQTLELPHKSSYSPHKPPLQNLQDYLRDKKLLLVLDNFEQVLDAGAEVAALLEVAPLLQILVTSRIVLHVYGEHEFGLPLLSVPPQSPAFTLPGEANPAVELTAEELMEYSAVQLLVERIRLWQVDFNLYENQTDQSRSLLAAICRELEGLPLAIELVAPQLKLLSPAELLARLAPPPLATGYRLELLTDGPRNLAARQQTIRNALEWSYKLLSETEQRLFEWLSIFPGGCTLEALEAVFIFSTTQSGEIETEGITKTRLELERGVRTLVNHSLLQVSVSPAPAKQTRRLSMLVTIGEYGLEKLGERGELELARKQHASYYLQVAEELHKKAAAKEDKIYFEQLLLELSNIRAALAWAVKNQARDMGIRFGVALGRFWKRRGMATEGRKFLEEVISQQGPIDQINLARGLNGLADMLSRTGDSNLAVEYLNRALTLEQAMDAKTEQAMTLYILADVFRRRGDYHEATKKFEQAIDLFRSSGELDIITLADCFVSLGAIATAQGNTELARARLQESLNLLDRVGASLEKSHGLMNFGILEIYLGNYAGAEAFLTEALALSKEGNYLTPVPGILNNLAMAVFFKGEYKKAEQYLREALPLLQAQGRKQDALSLQVNLSNILITQGKYLAARKLCQESLVAATELNFKPEITGSLNNLGTSAANMGEYIAASEYLQRSLELRKEMGDKRGIATCYYDLGQLSVLEAKYQQAEDYYEQSLTLRRKIDDKAGTSISLIGLAECYYFQGQFERARTYLLEGLDLALTSTSKLWPETLAGLSVLVLLLSRAKGQEQKLKISELLDQIEELSPQKEIVLALAYRQPLENLKQASTKSSDYNKPTSLPRSVKALIEKDIAYWLTLLASLVF